MNVYSNKKNYVSYSLDNYISFMSALKFLFLSFFHYVFSKPSATHIHSDWKRILESQHVAFVPKEQWNRIIQKYTIYCPKLLFYVPL